MPQWHIHRLGATERSLGHTLFRTIAGVFEEEPGAQPLPDAYVEQLLSRTDFWALAAVIGDDVVGGLTAHTLPMTRSAASEVFIYDLAVQPAHQRKGIGRALVNELRTHAAAAGIATVFVPAENEDTHALDFYRAIGGEPAAVTFFTFGS